MTFSFSLIFVFIVSSGRNKPIILPQTFIMVRKIAFQNLQKLYFKITSIKTLKKLSHKITSIKTLSISNLNQETAEFWRKSKKITHRNKYRDFPNGLHKS